MGAATSAILHQAGVIAYQVVGGQLRVLLVTSRETGRWIVPKGNIERRATPARAAAREAYEEAGVKGELAAQVPLGFYTYFKRLNAGGVRAATVEVYLLRVTECLKRWPEKGERRLCWVATEEAIRLVEEPGLVPLLHRLAEVEDGLVRSSAPA